MFNLLSCTGLLKIALISGFVACSISIKAQDKLPAHAIQVIGGYSKHGSGDLNGIVFGAEYIKYLSPRLSLNYNFRATINDGASTDAPVRFTTAGVQLGVNGGFSFIRTAKHEFALSVGAFGRYQSASNGSDGYTLYYPTVTGVPAVLVGYDNRTPQETFAVGGILQLHYNFTFQKGVCIGIAPGFQTDSNGDVIPQVAVAVSKRF